MHFSDELIIAQVKMIMTTSPSFPPSYFESTHSQEQDSKEKSNIYCEKFDAVFARIYKGNK
jgi:hypothetical protein